MKKKKLEKLDMEKEMKPHPSGAFSLEIVFRGMPKMFRKNPAPNGKPAFIINWEDGKAGILTYGDLRKYFNKLIPCKDIAQHKIEVEQTVVSMAMIHQMWLPLILTDINSKDDKK